MYWRVICNDAPWPSKFKTIEAALAAIGRLSDRKDLRDDHDWMIRVQRVDPNT